MTRRRVEVAVVLALLALGLGLRLGMCRGYVFAGSDSYGYLKLADEWRAHGRYALAPAPEPLHFARPPLYPLFVAAVKGGARAEMSGGEGWGRITTAQAFLDVFVTGLLVFFLARKLSGACAGAIALFIAMVMPFTVIAVGAALTECVAEALATAAIAALVLGRARPRRWFPAAGALVALSTLLRPDGLLLGFAFVPALWAIGGWRERAIVGLAAAAGFAVAFAPWPARNLIRFGQAWSFGCRVDRTQRPIVNWSGAHHWLASYGRGWQTFNWGSGCVFDRNCVISVLQVERDGGVDDDADRAALEALLQQRSREGLSEAVSRGFDDLAAAHRRHHPLRVLAGLPLQRAIQMWTDSFDEIFQKPMPIYGGRALRATLPAITIGFFIWLLLSSAVLLARPKTRADAAVLVTAIASRTAVLAFTFYCMPRYIREVMPLAYVLAGAGLVEGARWLAARRRAKISAVTEPASRA